MKPGEDPIGALMSELSAFLGDHRRWTCSQPERLIVMTSQRADYYGELQANAALFRLTETIDVPPLGADNLALVLREPARVLGVGFESDDLVSHVVTSVEDRPGARKQVARPQRQAAQG